MGEERLGAWEDLGGWGTGRKGLYTVSQAQEERGETQRSPGAWWTRGACERPKIFCQVIIGLWSLGHCIGGDK